MTISSSVRVAGPYTGTGSVSIYPFAFKVFQASDVLVKQTDLNGNVTTLALTTGYSVALNSDQNANPGGSIDLNTPLPNGYKLVISSQVQGLQGTSLTNNGGFYPNVIENALDYLTILVQQAQTEINASLQVPLGGSAYDAGAKRIANLVDGQNPTDASTVEQMQAYANSAVAGVVGGYGFFLAAGAGAAARTFQAKMRDVVSVLDFGADPTGINDSTTAFQNAINAAGNGGVVFVPVGNYRLSGQLTLLPLQTLYGEGYYLGTGGSPATQLYFTGTTGPAITCTSNFTLRNLLLRGTYSTNALQGVYANGGSPFFDNCQFYDFGTAVYLNASYYAYFHNCEWSSNGICVQANACYNVHFVRPRASTCTDFLYTTSNGVVGCSIHGGSIETFTTAFNFGAGGNVLSVFGTYFESSVAGTNAYGVSCAASDTINLFGCTIYLTNMNRFVNASGLANVNINAGGNRFVCPNTSTTVPIAYVLPSSGDVNLKGDNWVSATYATYSSNLSTHTNFNVDAPSVINNYYGEHSVLGRPQLNPILTAAPTYPEVGATYWADGVNWKPIPNFAGTNFPVVRTDSGTYRLAWAPFIGASSTANRPTSGLIAFVTQYFDATLNKPIWYTGTGTTGWVDATGTSA